MTRTSIVIRNEKTRHAARIWVEAAPEGTRIEFKEAKRTNEQNAKMWAMLGEIARGMRWHGLTLSPEDWKLIFLDALKHETRIVPNIDGTGFVNLGRSSSDLSVGEMADLIELIHAFAAQRRFVFRYVESA
jgi:NinB protein